MSIEASPSTPPPKVPRPPKPKKPAKLAKPPKPKKPAKPAKPKKPAKLAKPRKGKKKDEIVLKITRKLSVPLSAKEKENAIKNLVAKMDLVEALEEEKKAMVDGFKAKITQAKADIMNARQLVRNGAEIRDVNCQEIRDYKAGQFRIIRMDTEEVVDERPLTKEERQTHIPGT